ncbi:MAG: winged helix-turn-helix domain-containing protein [Desulfomonilaceae bacterium]
MDKTSSMATFQKVSGEAERLLEALEMSIDELSVAAAPSDELSAKRRQLEDILSMIQSWEKRGDSVPATFIELKNTLEREVAVKEEAVRRLTDIREKLGALCTKTERVIPQKKSGSRVGRPWKRATYRRGAKTSQAEYIPLIIEALKARNGRAEARFVRDWIKKNREHLFTPRDKERLNDGRGDYVWWNTVKWARNEMVKKGLLKKNSPKGIWELNE